MGGPFLQISVWFLSYFCRGVALFLQSSVVCAAFKQFICRWVALFSAVLCVALMFMLTWTYAAATVVCQIVLGAYIYYR